MEVFLQIVGFFLQTDASGRPVLSDKRKAPLVLGVGILQLSGGC